MILNLGLQSTKLRENGSDKAKNSNILCEIIDATASSLMVKIINSKNSKASKTFCK